MGTLQRRIPANPPALLTLSLACGCFVPYATLAPALLDCCSMRARFEKMIRGIQQQVCSAVEEVDGNTFRQDAWLRPGGGGGITKVMQEGNVWEKAGVAVSVVYGTMPAEAYRVAVGKDVPFEKVRKPLL